MRRPTSADPTGLAIAVASAAAFGASGPFAKALLEVGWTPGSAALVRIAVGAAVLAPTSLGWLRRHRPTRNDLRRTSLFGVFAVAGAQLCYFSAVKTLPVGIALLLEYLAPVLLVGWAWLRSWRPPARLTVLGTILSLGGLVLVLDVAGGLAVDPVGVLWGLGAALCLSSYFVIAAQPTEGMPALVVAAGGLAVGALTVGALGLVGLMPLAFSAAPVELLGATTSWLLPVAVLAVLSAAFAYATGVVSTQRLGETVASFVGLTEVVFAVLFAWLLVGQALGPVQLLGGLVLLTGVAIVQADHGHEGVAEVSHPITVDQPVA